ncbi:guanosine pentaphosphatase [Psychromonas sp. MME2]|uniref:Ppx/GppA phosphatase family protein n=1 Tax=unclassified Psychromonas TaxID=2614957 RepID=UPI00339C61D9
MQNNRYTIIDLGSNSFHMLTVEKTDDGFNVLAKHKRKVRLASGLDAQHNLNIETIENGLACLRYFKEVLNDIKPLKLIITATAALRLANNRDIFITQAESILAHPVNLISGIEEAETIYRGVAFTERTDEQLLIIDIGGASTELVIGKGENIIVAQSLSMGCVTWLANYFSDNKLNNENFNHAIAMANVVLQPTIESYTQQGWNLAMGASGTIQALQEINTAQQLGSTLTLPLLNKVKQMCIACESIDKLQIVGLEASRIPVFASGLSILIAIFEAFNIQQLKPSQGALREGLISIIFSDKTTSPFKI